MINKIAQEMKLWYDGSRLGKQVEFLYEPVAV